MGAKAWKTVIAYAPDRLSRQYTHQAFVEEELHGKGIKVLYVTVEAPKNEEDKVFHAMRGVFSQYERVKIAERFRLGKLRKIRDGHILVSKPLYGYNYVPKKDGRHGFYEVNDEEARTIRKIFSWIADEKMTLRGVVVRLKSEGILPRKSKRGVWSTSTLATLMRHEGYIGKAHWGSSYAVVPNNPTKKGEYRRVKKSSRRMREKSEWHTVNIPRLIEDDVFLRAGKQLDENFARCNRNVKNEYLLSRKIRCICGSARAGEGPQQGKHLYYRCANKVACFPLPRTCHEKGINARIADTLVWEKIVSLMTTPDLMRSQVERWFKKQSITSQSAVADVSEIKSRIEKLKLQEERYSKAYGAGVFTLEQLQGYVADIRAQQSQLQLQLSNAGAQSTHFGHTQPTAKELEVFCGKAAQQLKNLSFSQKREILLSVVETIEGTQERLRVDGYIPLNNIHVKFKTNHRNCRVTKCG